MKRRTVMVSQISLFTVDFELEVEEDSSTMSKPDKRSVASEAVVSLYRAEDSLTHKSYFGISDKPDIRFGDHKAGRHANADFKKALLERPYDFIFSIVCTFVVPDYCSKGNKSTAHAIEAFAMAFYESLSKGYNRSYKFHHDFLDCVYWEAVLPPELLLLYRNANHHKLNENVKPYIKKAKKNGPKKTHNGTDLLARRIIRDHLLLYKEKDIKIAKYAETLAMIDRSCYSRFMDGDTAVGVPRLLELISLVEEHLGIADRFDFEKEYLKAKQIQDSVSS